MKLKYITIVALVAFIVFGCGAEAKKKKTKTYSFPVLKSKVEGFSQPLIDIAQESIEFNLNEDYVTVKIKKVADFPHNYIPRIEALEITSLCSNSNGVSIIMTTEDNMSSIALKTLNDFVKQPVGSTIDVKLRLLPYCSADEIKKANIEGLGISKLIIVNNSEFEELLDFLMNFKKVVSAKDKNNFNQFLVKDYKFEDGENYFAIENEEDFLMDFDVLAKLNRDKIREGSQVITKNVKENFIDLFRIRYDEYYKAYIFSHCVYPIKRGDEYVDGDGDGTEESFIIVKVDSKYKIVGISFAG